MSSTLALLRQELVGGTVRPGWPPFSIWFRSRRLRRAAHRMAAAQNGLLAATIAHHSAGLDLAESMAELNAKFRATGSTP